jgi:heme exporter protein CcmD
MTAFYLWGAYGVTFVLLAAEIAFLARRVRHAQKANKVH